MTNSNVLLVEDNPVNQEIGRTMIEAFGCRVDVASNGYEVLDRIESTRYDIVFMDCLMPVMDGLEATRSIRRREKQQGGHRVTIIALTANVTDEDRSRCLDAGMDDYLGKPFHMSDLSRMMTKWCAGISAWNAAVSGMLDPNSGAWRKDAENYLDRASLDKIRLLGPKGPGMLSAIIGIYLNDSPILLDRLSEAFGAADTDGVGKAAHALKSSSAGLGATVLAGMCRQVEDIARKNSIEGVGTLISRIRLEYEIVKEALTCEIQK